MQKNSKKIARGARERILQVIGQTEKDSKRHVNDANNNGHFHFERIRERDCVLRQSLLPNLNNEANTFILINYLIRSYLYTGSIPNG